MLFDLTARYTAARVQNRSQAGSAMVEEGHRQPINAVIIDSRLPAIKCLPKAALLVFVLVAVTNCSMLEIYGPTNPNTKKAFVCHKGKKSLSISEAAVNAHLKHGDYLGPCL